MDELNKLFKVFKEEFGDRLSKESERPEIGDTIEEKSNYYQKLAKDGK